MVVAVGLCVETGMLNVDQLRPCTVCRRCVCREWHKRQVTYQIGVGKVTCIYCFVGDHDILHFLYWLGSVFHTEHTEYLPAFLCFNTCFADEHLWNDLFSMIFKCLILCWMECKSYSVNSGDHELGGFNLIFFSTCSGRKFIGISGKVASEYLVLCAVYRACLTNFSLRWPAVQKVKYSIRKWRVIITATKPKSQRAPTKLVCGCVLEGIHTHPFNGPLSGTTRVSRYQSGKTDLDFVEAKRLWVTASAGLYATLHLAPDI